MNKITPENQSVLEKELAPVIKAYEMENAVVSVPNDFSYTAAYIIKTVQYCVYAKGKNLVGTFFTKKKAEEFLNLFDGKEINSLINSSKVKLKIGAETVDITLDQLMNLAKHKGIKINFNDMASSFQK